jgi:F-type H+-transporting ATPase subunit gamma
MANLKEVRTRIESVKSTQQITKAMKMVAASKLRKAQDAILQMRPYATRLGKILENVTAALNGEVQSPYAKQKEVEQVLMVVITSDRGLCGAFNSNVIKATLAHIEEHYQPLYDSGKLWIMPIGKKAYDFFRKHNYKIIDSYWNIFQDISFENVREASSFAMQGFLDDSFDHIDMVYNEFKNVATQILKVEQFLPLNSEEQDLGTQEGEVNYIFEPSVDYIVKELIPQTLNIQFYKAILESNASEHGARMTAMDQATENAGELLLELRLLYNQTRQAAITTEILEIVGGAEALQNG